MKLRPRPSNVPKNPPKHWKPGVYSAMPFSEKQKRGRVVRLIQDHAVQDKDCAVVQLMDGKEAGKKVLWRRDFLNRIHG